MESSGAGIDDATDSSIINRDHFAVYSNRNSDTRDESALTGHIMTLAYAIGVIILSVGLVILTVTLAVLCFLYPDKANSFLILLASPVIILVVGNAFKIGKIVRYIDARQIADSLQLEEKSKQKK